MTVVSTKFWSIYFALAFLLQVKLKDLAHAMEKNTKRAACVPKGLLQSEELYKESLCIIHFIFLIF